MNDALDPGHYLTAAPAAPTTPYAGKNPSGGMTMGPMGPRGQTINLGPQSPQRNYTPNPFSSPTAQGMQPPPQAPAMGAPPPMSASQGMGQGMQGGMAALIQALRAKQMGGQMPQGPQPGGPQMGIPMMPQGPQRF